MIRDENQIDVVIIGAGLSGLMAGYTLKKRGKSFIILEAQSRVGGRVYSTTFEGNTIDLGAQWISPNQTRINKLLNEFDISSTRTYKIGTSLYSLLGGRKIGTEKTPPFSIFSKIDLYRMTRIVRKLLKEIDLSKPLQSEMAKKLDVLTIDAWIDQKLISKYGKEFYRLISQEGVCTDLSKVSVLNVMWDIKTTGRIDYAFSAEEEWISKGAQTLPNLMAKGLGDAVKMNEEVQIIDWTNSIVQIYTKKSKWNCKKVILAMSPTLTNQIEYIPILPAARNQLCQRVMQGTVIKCIIVYDHPFWRKKGQSGISYYDKGPVKTTIDSSTPGQNKGILTAFVTGSDACRLGELDEVSRKNEVLHCLSYLFGDEALKPIAYFEKDWSADPWSRGGYSGYFAPGTLTHYGEFLSNPIGPIHFAGTETAREWRLYMEGALESGERAALEVYHELN